jgi:hypothetical protein
VLRNVNSAPSSNAIGAGSKSAPASRRQNGSAHKPDRNDNNDPFSALSEAVSEQHHSDHYSQQRVSLSLAARSNGSMVLGSSSVLQPNSASPQRPSAIKRAFSPRHGGTAQIHNLIDDSSAGHIEVASAAVTATLTEDSCTDAMNKYDAKQHLLVSGSNGDVTLTVSDDVIFNKTNSNLELGMR